MKCCPQLLGDINFEPQAISPCCNVHAIRTPTFPYSGGEVDLDAYGKFLLSSLKELQEDTNLCKGCPHLGDFDITSRTMMVAFRTISLNMHRFFCNCKCVYCGLWPHRNKGYGYDPLPAIRSLHEQKALRPDCAVSWGGGESSILPFFENTSEWVARAGYFQLVHTNALRFSPAMANLMSQGLGRIDISLDSSSRETYKNVKGVDGFEKVMENLHRYCREGHPLAINLKYIIFDLNNGIGEIGKFLRLAYDLGIKTVEMSFDFREVNAGKVSEKTCIAAAYMQKQSEALGLDLVPFFVDKPIMERIKDAAALLS